MYAKYILVICLWKEQCGYYVSPPVRVGRHIVFPLVSVQDSYRPGKVLEFDLGPGKLMELVPFVLELSWNFVKLPLKM